MVCVGSRPDYITKPLNCGNNSNSHASLPGAFIGKKTKSFPQQDRLTYIAPTVVGDEPYYLFFYVVNLRRDGFVYFIFSYPLIRCIYIPRQSIQQEHDEQHFGRAGRHQDEGQHDQEDDEERHALPEVDLLAAVIAEVADHGEAAE